MPKVQKIGVSAFLSHNHKVLIVKRAVSEEFLPGYFEMPGGKVEFGEPPEEALKREILEELSFKINVLYPFFTFSYTTDLNDIHTIDIQYLATINGGIDGIKLSKEHDDYAWISESEIDNYKISDAMKLALNKGFAASKIK